MVHNCLVELQYEPLRIKGILRKYNCVLYYTYEIENDKIRCYAILSDGKNDIQAKAISNVDYSIPELKKRALDNLLGILK